MNFYKDMPKFRLKSFATTCCRFNDNRLVSQMPEVPLTRACVQTYYVRPERRPECMCPQKVKIKEQRKAVKGLSNWYIQHLNAMNDIQRQNEFSKWKECEAKCAAKAFEMQQQETGVNDLTLENYFHSLLSRQKKFSSLGKPGKVWEKYFERTVPGWKKAKQSKYLDLRNVYQLITERNAQKEIEGATNSNGELLCAQDDPGRVRFSQKIENAKMIRAAEIENRLREYFEVSPIVKNERRVGNINNEILFNAIYGQYMPRYGPKSRFGKADSRRSSNLAKKTKSSEVMLLRKLRNSKKAASKDPKTIKLIEDLIKEREKARKIALMNLQKKEREKTKNKRNAEDENDFAGYLERKSTRDWLAKKWKQHRSASLIPLSNRVTPSLLNLANDSKTLLKKASDNNACKKSTLKKKASKRGIPRSEMRLKLPSESSPKKHKDQHIPCCAMFCERTNPALKPLADQITRSKLLLMEKKRKWEKHRRSRHN